MMRFVMGAFSGLAYGAMFPPWDQGWLGFVILTPLFSVLCGASLRHRLMLGALWGLLSNYSVGWWVPGAINYYYEQPSWFGPLFGVTASFVFWIPYIVAFAALSEPVRRCVPIFLQPLAWAALWVTVEFGRASVLTGAPWGLLGNAMVSFVRLAQAADLGGVYLLSFVPAAINGAIVVLIGRHTLRVRLVTATLAVLPVVFLVAYGTWRMGQPLAAGPAVSVRVVQGNNQDGAYWRPGAYGKGIDDYLRLSRGVDKPALLIWPEAAVTVFLAEDARYQERIREVLREIDTTLIVGAPHHDDTDPAVPRFLNSAYAMRGDMGITGRYDKRHLLPFVEYFPLRIDFLRRRFERVRVFTPGTGDVLLQTPLGPTAVVICFEGIFPGVVGDLMRKGARALVVLSNDVWLGRGTGPEQHLAMVRLRAIENHTWVIRSTTTGVSALIDPFGRIVQRGPIFEPAVLQGEVVPVDSDTVYERWGDLFAWACAVLSLALAIRAWLCGGYRSGTSLRTSSGMSPKTPRNRTNTCAALLG